MNSEKFRILPRPSDSRMSSTSNSMPKMSNYGSMMTYGGRNGGFSKNSPVMSESATKMSNISQFLDMKDENSSRMNSNVSFLPKNEDISSKIDTKNITNNTENLYSMTAKTISTRESLKEQPQPQVQMQSNPAGGNGNTPRPGPSRDPRSFRSMTMDDAIFSSAMLPLWRQRFNG